MTWDFSYFTGLLLVVLLLPCIKAEVSNTSFSAAELELFARMQLCSRFGGESATCGVTCPHRFIRHRYGVPLCPNLDHECCIGPAPNDTESSSPNERNSSTTTTTTTVAPTPQETSNSGSCGVMSSQGRRRKRIVGGSLSSVGRWPWLAALRSQLTGAHTCSGALIKGGWVVTAAHCFKYVSNPSLWRVRLGEFDLLSTEAGETDLTIDTIILHPGYTTERKGNATSLRMMYIHDIALIKLSHPVHQEPICLPESFSSPVDQTPVRRRRSGRAGSGACWVAGWGDTRDPEITDQHLREVTGQVHASDVCGQMWGVRLEEDMLCFGDGTYGPCAGDSGGPLSCQASDGRFYLSGVVSWGTDTCNTPGYPSVFTNLSPYLAWINQTIS